MSEVPVIDMVAASAPSPPPPALPGRFLLLIVDPHEDAACLAEEVGAVGVETLVCADPAEALLQVGIAQPDAVLLAPDIAPLDTIAVVRALTRRSSVPVLVGVGDGDGRSAVEALAAGALACVARPFRTGEVLTILRSIRRDDESGQPSPGPQCDPNTSLTVGVLHLDMDAREARLRGRPIRLPPQELRLLHLLMRNVGRVVTREQIWAEVWGNPSGLDSSNTVTVHIRRLRARLGEGPNEAVSIVTIRGMGYRLTVPSE